jgi:hypothetical protein
VLQPTADDARHQREPVAAPDSRVFDTSPVQPVGGFATQLPPSTATVLVPPPITTAGPIAPGPVPVGADRAPSGHDGAHLVPPGAATLFPPAANNLAAAATSSATAHAGGPSPPLTELPAPAPVGAVGSGGSATSAAASSAGALAILFILLLVPCLRYGRVELAPARWRPVLFVSLLERPG